MEKSIFEQMVGTYHQQGDYLLPDLATPENILVMFGANGICSLSRNTARPFTSAYS